MKIKNLDRTVIGMKERNGNIRNWRRIYIRA